MKKVLTILGPFIVMLLIGCAARPPENLMTAADRREQSFDSIWVVYTLPDMDRVSVANVTYKEGLTMDVYYPPDFDFRSKLPAVVFVNGGSVVYGVPTDFRDVGQFISWGQLTAASGLIAITHDNEVQDALNNFDDLMNYIHKKGGSFGIDSKRIGLWSRYPHASVAQSALMDTSQEYQRNLRCAVFYYSGLDIGEPTVKEWRRDVPQLVVKGGLDLAQRNSWIDQYIAKAREMKVPVELVVHEEGAFRFDALMDTDRSR